MGKGRTGKAKAKAKVDATSAPDNPLHPLRSSLVRCSENIALLHLLREVHGPPTRNQDVYDTDQHEDPRHLPFRYERIICRVFAFFASITDDPEIIPAVCLQEEPATASLKVLLSVNKAKPNDGNDKMIEVERGFKSIWRALSRTGGVGEDEGVEDEVFQAVVSMCSARILSRLRILQTRRRKSKISIQTLLNSVLTHFSRPRLQDNAANIFRGKAQDIIKRIRSWEQYRQLQPLKLLVDGIYNLARIPNYKGLIHTIPNRIMDPSARRSLCNMIDKVAQYRRFSRYLHRMARRFPILRQGSTLLVDLGATAFTKFVKPQVAGCDLVSAGLRAGVIRDPKELNHICSHLNITATQASASFSKQATKTLSEGKIHAEIQLVYHYLVNPIPYPPRVICSSKDACYLCNMFLGVMKMFHIPRCHSRLYPGWRLPYMPEFEDTASRFNRELERKATDIIFAVLNGEKTRTYEYPNESNIISLESSASALVMSDQNITTLGPHPETKNLETENQKGGKSFDQLHLPENGMESTGGDAIRHVDVDVKTRDQTRSLSATSRQDSYLKSQDTLLELEDRQTVEGQSEEDMSSTDGPPTVIFGAQISCTLRPGEASPLYSNRLLEIQVENSCPQSKKSDKQALSFCVDWLSTRDVESLQGYASIVEAESICGEIPYNMGNDKGVFISHMGHIARIQLS